VSAPDVAPQPPPPTSRRQARTDAAAGARRYGRAGRDVGLAVGVGLLLGALVVGSLFIVKEAFVVFAVAAVVVALWELTEAFSARRIDVPLIPVAVGGVGMLVSAYGAGEEALLVAMALTAGGVVVWRVLDRVGIGAVRDAAAGVFCVAYVPLLASFAMLMLARDDGPQRILLFIGLTVASDVGGYVAGVAVGRHPMAPTISPAKSWEGFAGSVVATTAIGAAVVPALLDGPWWAGAATGLAVALTATGGDLAESMLKRDLGVKDMGNLLPGHGGAMDRLDSLLPSAAASYVLLTTLVP